MKILYISIMAVMMGCCPKCPPTEICPTTPKPREVTRPTLGIPKLKVGDKPAFVIKTMEDDLGKCLRYSEELETLLNGYR